MSGTQDVVGQDSWLAVLNHEGILHHWITQVILVAFFTLVASLIVHRLLAKLAAQLTRTRTLWDDALVQAASRPLVVMIWLVGVFWAVEIVYEVSQVPLFSGLLLVRKIGVILLLVWFLVRFIRNAEAILVSPEKVRKPMDETTAAAIGRLLRVSLIIVAVLVVLQSLGYSISGVLAFGGIGGIAVGFAAKDLLSNFFGGLMIYLDRPFTVGDWVRSPDRAIEGTVEDIGWRQTRIRTFDKRPLYIPNATFASILVENPSRMSHRRIYETIGIRYDDAARVEQIVADVRGLLLQHDEIDKSQTMIVNFNAFSESSLDFFVYAFTHTTNWIRYHEIKQDILLAIHRIITSHGAEIALPSQTLHVNGGHRPVSNEPELAGLVDQPLTGEEPLTGEKPFAGEGPK